VLANGTPVQGRIVPSASEPRLSRCFDALDRDRNFTAENFHTISTDPHIGNMVIPPVIELDGANKKAAGTVHFEFASDCSRREGELG